jgi:hypothetical protein
MLRFVCSIYLVFQLGIFSTAIAQMSEDYQLNVTYSYGSNQLLPSLITNSNLDFDRDNLFSDFWIQGGFKISDKLFFNGGLELTDQPHELIGTKFSRPDFPLSTGRFHQSVVKYESENLTVRLGRDDMLSSELRPTIFTLPTSGDGFSWHYKLDGWDFNHVFQVLPAENGENQVFRRSVSYHHLSKNFNNHTIGAGEYFILSGNQLGFDLKRLNPFLPYSLNSHDSEADFFSGFSGDSDNSLIKFFWKWRNKSSKISVNLYIDEFQIDAVDREVFSDAILLSFSRESELFVFHQQGTLNYGFSMSNPNFGQHPGPFTTTTIGAFPLFEYAPGMQSLYFFETQLFTERSYQISLSGFSEKWLDIKHLPPDQMNLRAELDKLPVNTDSRVSIAMQFKFARVPLRFVGVGWVGTDDDNNSGVKIGLQLNWGNSSKQ